MAGDNATINLYINNEQAKASIAELEDAYKKLKDERKKADDAGDIQKSLILQAQEHTALMKLREAKRGILDIETAMANISVINIKQLTDVRGKLRRELSLLNQGTDDFIEKQKQLIKVEEQLSIAQSKRNNEQKGFMGSIKNLWTNVAPVAGLTGALMVVGNFVKGLISDVWTLTQTIQGDSKRAMTVFGDELGYVELQAQRLSKQAGVTTREFVAMTTATADLLIPLDFSREKSARMAVEVQKLTGALNEWTAGKFGAEDISNRLTKAMLGETEGLKQLGIAIRLDSDEYKNLIKQKLASGEATTAQAQAEAILELLYKKSADAQTAYNSSGNDLLRFQNASARGWREMKESMAEWFATTKQERVEKLARTYKALNDEFLTNENTLDRLMPVYENLSSKTNLNETEQQQLRDAIDGIVQIIPHAATGFDEYGRALGVNMRAVTNFREAQRLLNLEMNKKVSEGLVKELANFLTEANLAMGKAGSWNDPTFRSRYLRHLTGDKLRDKEIEFEKAIAKQLEYRQDALNKAAKNVTILEELGYTREEIVDLAKKEARFNSVNLELVNKITDAYNNQLNSKPISDKEAEIKKLNEELSQLTDQAQITTKKAEIARAEEDLKKLKGENKEVLGLIEAKEKELKKLQDELPKLTDEKEIVSKNKEIEKLEKEIKNLKDLGKSSGTAGSKSQSWSLENEKSFLESRAVLRAKMLNGDIKTEEEFNSQLLALEVATLQKRIDANLDKGEELLKLRDTLAQKQLQQDKATKAERQKLLDLIDTGKSETERAEIEYRKQLISYGLFTAEQLDDEQAYHSRSRELTEEQHLAVEILATRHRSRLREIYNSSLTNQANKEMEHVQREANRRKIQQDTELGELKSFGEKKAWLVKRFGFENLSQIRTEKDAEKALTTAYATENEQFTKESLNRILTYYRGLMASLISMNPMGVVLNQQEIDKLLDIIAQLEAKLAGIKGEKPNETNVETNVSSVDILGMSANQWAEMFQRLDDSKIKLGDILLIAGALGQAFAQVNNLINAMEQRELRNYEKTQNAKKKSLESRLKSGALSEEYFNEQVQRIDEQTQAKREETEKKQAERAKMLSVFQAIVNTAVAVTSALGAQPFGAWNIALASVIGALGAVQIGTILATPLGFADGGLVEVERAQDGRRFHARRNYLQRGYINQPTLLVSEEGGEVVVPNKGLQNPTLRPMLDIVVDSINRGDIRTLDFRKALAPKIIDGYSSRGSTQRYDVEKYPTSGNDDSKEANTQERDMLMRIMKKIEKRLAKPAIVVMSGKNGVARQYDEYNSIRKEI